MRDTPPCRWLQWRVKLVEPLIEVRAPRFIRPLPGQLEPPLTSSAECRGPDGIRHELVARIRREIEAGTYDTEEKWQLAEERLFECVAGTV